MDSWKLHCGDVYAAFRCYRTEGSHSGEKEAKTVYADSVVFMDTKKNLWNIKQGGLNGQTTSGPSLQKV